MALAILAASVNHSAWPPVLILIDAPFPSRLSRYTINGAKALSILLEVSNNG